MSANVVTNQETVKDAVYESILNHNESGVMGYIEIPKIQIMVPVYHYSSDDILDKGIGHIHGSSFPVGGIGTHSVLTGHRGLPESKLFTDLDQVKEGDRFYLHMLTRDLAYEVISVRVVLPYEVSDLKVDADKDQVTLVTCTPYGVNTHRLLVTGERTDYDETIIEQEEYDGKILSAESRVTPMNAMVFGFVVFMIVVFGSLIVMWMKGKKRKKR